MLHSVARKFTKQCISRGVKTNPQHTLFPSQKQPMMCPDSFKGLSVKSLIFVIQYIIRFSAMDIYFLSNKYFNCNVSGQVILVTGGATGLGKGMATMLSSLGAKVFIASRNETKLKEACDEISSVTGNEVKHYRMDIKDHEQVKLLI